MGCPVINHQQNNRGCVFYLLGAPFYVDIHQLGFVGPDKIPAGAGQSSSFFRQNMSNRSINNRLESLRSIEAKGSKVHLGRLFGSLRPTILDVEKNNRVYIWGELGTGDNGND